uniref:Pentatricopeptide repeat-containing protein n=1 Tax=Brassica oleracea var. oleracea TaxID=109376 RepID=A0A0D3CHX7_BRAOL
MVDDRTQDGTQGKGNGDGFAHLGRPDDIDVSIKLRDWLFALEGREGVTERCWHNDNEDIGREERCWHTNFHTFQVIAKSTPKLVDPNVTESNYDAHRYSVDSVNVSQYMAGGVNIEANIVASEDKSGHDDTLNWAAESLKFSVKQPVTVDKGDSFSYPSLYLKALKLCSYQTIEKQFVLIHGNSVTNGFISNLHLNNSLDIGYHRSALLLFKEMRREPFRANDFTYGSVLKSCKDLGCLKEGMQIHGCVEKGRFAENLVVRSALLCLYAKCGKMEDARLLFESMKVRDLVSWNIMLDGYTEVSTADTSFSLFQLMLAEGKKPDCYTFGSLLRACIEVNCLEMVSQLHGFAIKLCFGRSDVALVRSLIVAYAKCGSLGNALKLYDRTMKGDLISCVCQVW